MNATETPRIYVASLADYNAGRLVGAWIDADQDAEAIHAEVQAMLATSKEPIAEEWAIHDYDGFGELTISEYEDFETVAEMGIAISEHGGAYAAYASHVGADYATLEGFEESYRGEYESEKDFAYELFEELGYENELPEHLRHYFDYDAWTRDLFMSDCYSVKTPDYNVWVFWSH